MAVVHYCTLATNHIKNSFHVQHSHRILRFRTVYKYLTVKDVLWCGLLEFDVPHEGNTIRFMRSIFVIVIGSDKQLGILRERERRRRNVGEEKKLIPNLDLKLFKASYNNICNICTGVTTLNLASPEGTSRDR